MLGEGRPRKYSLHEILTEKQVQEVLRKHFTDGKVYKLVGGEARPAVAGALAGYLADHVRAALHVQAADTRDVLQLFIKRIPVENKPKAELITVYKYFDREDFILQLAEEMKGGEGDHAWCCPAYVRSASLIVMPDLAARGYSARPLLPTLDLPHMLCAARSIARFHAAFANYETQKTSDVRQSNFYLQFEHILSETTFQDTPWVRTGAKLTADLINAFSTKYRDFPQLEEKLAKSFVEACSRLHVAHDTLNVIVHKDLWVNNILFRYEGGVPSHAVLIDYQCVRAGPPAFDLAGFLYLNTTRSFRDRHERPILRHYFETFSAALEDGTKKRLESLGYDERELLDRYERARMFGAFEAVAIYPQVLMDGASAARVFDDPQTYLQLVERDRSPPVIAYARMHSDYLRRNLEVSEEFVERFVSRTS